MNLRKLETYNLIKYEITSTKYLSEREVVLFTKASKGSALLIMNVNNYTRKMKITENYKKTPGRLNNNRHEIVDDTIERLKKQKLVYEKVNKD